jgi:hypothetical protein
MEKEKDHDSFSDSVSADTNGECGGTENKNEDKAGERVVDREI